MSDQPTAKCSIFVLGAEIQCPLCGAIIMPGQHHMCEVPQHRIRRLAPPKDGTSRSLGATET
jgi:hypothetical protein